MPAAEPFPAARPPLLSAPQELGASLPPPSPLQERAASLPLLDDETFRPAWLHRRDSLDCPARPIVILYLHHGYLGTPEPRPIPSWPAQSSCRLGPAPQVVVSVPRYDVPLPPEPRLRHAVPPQPSLCDASDLAQGPHSPLGILPYSVAAPDYYAEPPGIQASQEPPLPTPAAAPQPHDNDA